MITRTTRKTVTFTRPFSLSVIDGLSFLAYRRVGTLLHLPSTSSRVGVTKIVTVNPSELEVALERHIRQSGSHE